MTLYEILEDAALEDAADDLQERIAEAAMMTLPTKE